MVKRRAEDRRRILYDSLKEKGVIEDIDIIDNFDASASVLYQDRQYLLEKYPNEIVYDNRKKRSIWIGEGSPEPNPELEKKFFEMYDKCKDEVGQFNFDELVWKLAPTYEFSQDVAVQYLYKKIINKKMIKIKKGVYKLLE